MTKTAIAARRRYRRIKNLKGPAKSKGRGRGRRRGRGRGRRGGGRGAQGAGFWEDVGNGLLQVAGTVLPFIL